MPELVDALSISRRELGDRLRAVRRGLKSALLDQSVLAGLGNLLVDETLWRARLRPRHDVASERASVTGRTTVWCPRCQPESDRRR